MESRNEGKRNFENVAATWPPFFNISEGKFLSSVKKMRKMFYVLSAV